MQSILNYLSHVGKGAGGDQRAKKLKKVAWTEARDCWKDDKVRENIAVQTQARRKFKGKDNKKQAMLIVPCSPRATIPWADMGNFMFNKNT